MGILVQAFRAASSVSRTVAATVAKAAAPVAAVAARVAAPVVQVLKASPVARTIAATIAKVAPVTAKMTPAGRAISTAATIATVAGPVARTIAATVAKAGGAVAGYAAANPIKATIIGAVATEKLYKAETTQEYQPPTVPFAGGSFGEALGVGSASRGILAGLGIAGAAYTAETIAEKLGVRGGAGFVGAAPGAGIGGVVVKRWNAGGAPFERFSDGRIAVTKKNGMVKVYRPYHATVFGKKVDAEKFVRLSRRYRRVHHELNKIFGRRTSRHTARGITHGY